MYHPLLIDNSRNRLDEKKVQKCVFIIRKTQNDTINIRIIITLPSMIILHEITVIIISQCYKTQ